MIDAYLTYAPLYDLLFQVMLMFGMVMASTGQVQEELEAVNADLKRARDRVEASVADGPADRRAQPAGVRGGAGRSATGPASG